MVLQAGVSRTKRTLLQTPTEHRTQTDEPWPSEATPGRSRLPTGKSAWAHPPYNPPEPQALIVRTGRVRTVSDEDLSMLTGDV